MHWVKEHPYLTGGLVLGLIVFYFIFKAVAGSSGTSQSDQSGTTVVQGSSGASDAVQQAQIAAGASVANTQAAATANSNQLAAALAAAQIDANTQTTLGGYAQNVALGQSNYQAQTALGLSSDQLAAVNSQVTGAVDMTTIQANRDITINSQNVGGAVTIAGTQAQATMYGYATALAGQKDIDSTSLAINGQNTQAAIAINGQNTSTDLAKTVNTNQAVVDVTNSNNAASIANTQATANVYINQTNANANVQNNLINTSAGLQNSLQNQNFALATAQAGYNKNIADQLMSQISSGVYNKGGQGGANNISALNTFLGAPTISTAAQGQVATSDAATSGMWSNIVGSISSAASGFFSAGTNTVAGQLTK